jgi:DNA-binding MarR family transcriptional regulator
MNEQLFELILAVKRKCQGNEDEICGCLGLSQAELHGLLVLEGRQEILGGDFSGRMGLSPSRGSRVLNRLVTDGLAQAHLGSDDRRTIRVGLTGKGRRTRGQIAKKMRACEDRIRSRLNEQDLEQVRKALKQLTAVL